MMHHTTRYICLIVHQYVNIMYEWVALSHFNLAGDVAFAEFSLLEEYEARVDILRDILI